MGLPQYTGHFGVGAIDLEVPVREPRSEWVRVCGGAGTDSGPCATQALGQSMCPTSRSTGPGGTGQAPTTRQPSQTSRPSER